MLYWVLTPYSTCMSILTIDRHWFTIVSFFDFDTLYIVPRFLASVHQCNRGNVIDWGLQYVRKNVDWYCMHTCIVSDIVHSTEYYVRGTGTTIRGWHRAGDKLHGSAVLLYSMHMSKLMHSTSSNSLNRWDMACHGHLSLRFKSWAVLALRTTCNELDIVPAACLGTGFNQNTSVISTDYKSTPELTPRSDWCGRFCMHMKQGSRSTAFRIFLLKTWTG